MKKNINEEIKRIKSLFTEERLYGNLVNETCDDLGDAVEFLQTQGYSITKDVENPCIGSNTDLSLAYNEVKNTTNTAVVSRIDSTDYGCRLKIFNKSPNDTAREGSIFTINLYEGTTQKQFTAYYMLKSEDACKMSVAGYDVNIYDLQVLGVSLLKVRYIKIWGTWEIDGGKVKLKNAEVDAILNDKEKKVTKTVKVSTVNLNIGHNQNLFTKNGDQNQCGKAIELLQHNLPWLTFGGVTDLETLISKI